MHLEWDILVGACAGLWCQTTVNINCVKHHFEFSLQINSHGEESIFGIVPPLLNLGTLFLLILWACGHYALSLMITK